MARWLQRLLFVDAPPRAQGAPTTREPGSTWSLALRRAPGLPARALDSCLRQEVLPWVPSWSRGEGSRRFRLYRDASRGGALTFFLNWTRSHGVVRRLCEIRGRPSPPPYRVEYRPRYDAILEWTSAEGASEELEDRLATLRSELAASEVVSTLCRSERRYCVYDSGRLDRHRAVFLSFLLRRPPGTSREQCQRYWLHQHADLAVRNLRYLQFERYDQVHTVAGEGRPPEDDGWDGLVYVAKRSLAKLLGDLGKPNSARINDTVVLDELAFTLDTPVLLLRQTLEV